MSVADWAVIAIGVGVIGWINWYFFWLGTRGVTAATVGGVQEIRVRVAGGFEPAEVRVQAGVPLRLLFDRLERGGCSEEVVFPDFGITRFLPAGQTTAIELVPNQPGFFEFTCGMRMLRGRLNVVATEAK